MRCTAFRNPALTGVSPVDLAAWLSLDDTKVDDDAIRPLAALPNLQALCLSVTRISNNAITDLRTFGKLSYLAVSNTMLSDACLAHFPYFKALTFLNIKFTRISPSALDQLSAKMPNVKIESKPKPLPEDLELYFKNQLIEND